MYQDHKPLPFSSTCTGLRLGALTMAKSPRAPAPGEPPVPSDAPPRTKRRRSASLAETSQGLLLHILKSAGLPFPELLFKWTDIVGPRLARLMVPVRYRPGPPGQGGTLVVEAAPAASFELQQQTDVLIARMNAALGRPAIAKLKVERSAYRPPARHAPLPPARPLTDGEKETIAALAQPIGEPQLKAALEALAGQVLRKHFSRPPGG